MNEIDTTSGKVATFPHITMNGRWMTTEDGYWTGGFWIGLLWHAYKLTNNEKYLKLAYHWIELLKYRTNDKTFDLGFLFYPSFAQGYEITRDEALKNIALKAADALSSLFYKPLKLVYSETNLKGEVVEKSIIDVMMDLPLLWWAYEETQNMQYYDVAYNHSLRAIECLIRKDYSTIHVIYFDLKTGEIIKKGTYQGFGDDSCWSRGQAWAMYGFTLAYKTTRDTLFLKTAEKISNFFLHNLPEDHVPCWDFNDPEIPNSVRDSSAAAIACSGLLTLYEVNGKKEYYDGALELFDALSKDYIAEKSDGILKHGCFHKPANMGVNESLIWGGLLVC